MIHTSIWMTELKICYLFKNIRYRWSFGMSDKGVSPPLRATCIFRKSNSENRPELLFSLFLCSLVAWLFTFCTEISFKGRIYFYIKSIYFYFTLCYYIYVKSDDKRKVFFLCWNWHRFLQIIWYFKEPLM
jgi:hypothetical protein